MRRLRYLRAGARAPGAAVLLAFSLRTVSLVSLLTASLLLVVGCGPIQYTSQVSRRAAGAVAAAKQANADQYAPYEYTAAVEYLHKAREEGGHAEYQVAIEYGRRAEDFAARALAIADGATAGKRSAATAGRPAAPHEPPVRGGDSP